MRIARPSHAPPDVDRGDIGADRAHAGIPMGRMGTTEEVAGVVFQLCGTDFGYVTGTEIFLTRGQHLF